jgi:hypothetical protein
MGSQLSSFEELWSGRYYKMFLFFSAAITFQVKYWRIKVAKIVSWSGSWIGIGKSGSWKESGDGDGALSSLH